jgi:hypothetical protein
MSIMKIQISYIKSEEKTVCAILAAIRSVLPGATTRNKENHPPRKHIYITLPEN